MTRSWRGPLIFFGYPILEILVFVWVASLIGWGWTFVLLLAAFGAGLAVMRWAGMSAFRALADPAQRAQAFSQVDPETGEETKIYPSQDVTEEDMAQASKGLRLSGLLFAGGALLAVPGFISDVCGILLILPPVRRWLGNRMAARASSQGGIVVVGETVANPDGTATDNSKDRYGFPNQPKERPDVIQGEILPPKPRDSDDQ